MAVDTSDTRAKPGRPPRRVLLLGPLPRAGEPIGGATVLAAGTRDGFQGSGRFAVETVDTSRRRAGRGPWARRLADALTLARVLLALLARAGRADVVLFQASSGGLLRAGPLVWLACRLRRRPLVARAFGGNLDLAFERAPGWLRALARRTVLASDLVLLETGALCERFAREARVARLPNTRPLPTTWRRARPTREPRFVVCGQLRSEKGLDVLVRALRAVEIDCTVDLWGPVVGDVPAELLSGSGPRARWRHLGVLAPADVPAALAEADALLFPSTWEGEGMPGVVVEALQVGLPVVATRWRALPELVLDGANGLLVEPGSAEGLRAAIERLAGDPSLREWLGRGALATGRELDAAQWHRRLEDHLDTVLERREGTLVRRLDRRLYPGVEGRWDDELLRSAVLARLEPDDRLLDLGAGAGVVPQMDFRGRAERVCGLDPDPRVAQNPHLDEARVGRAEELPWENASFDLVVADNLLEHLEEPARALAEVARVLRPGGHFLAKTPNRRHYVPLVARLTPHALHRRLNRLRGRAEADTFPTHYRANTPETVERLARDAGLEVASVRLVESRPEYLRWSAPTYVLGWLWERLVNRVPALARFRVLLLIELVKPAEARAAEPDPARWSAAA